MCVCGGGGGGGEGVQIYNITGAKRLLLPVLRQFLSCPGVHWAIPFYINMGGCDIPGFP